MTNYKFFRWIAMLAMMALLSSTAIQRLYAAERAPVKVLILSGRNNHDWKTTTPALKKILEDNGRFAVPVDVTEPPAKLDAASLAKYDVIISNWSNWPKTDERDWGPDVEKAVLDFVRGGKGFVLFHAAAATFISWPEFQQMAGSTWGKETHHGKQHEFKVVMADKDHPITRGLQDFWITDELWRRAQMQPTAHILCRALSAKDPGESGQDEPVAHCSEFGKGRCFNLILGHDTKVMQNAAWTVLMTRGVEWAATGTVTMNPPAAWPSAPASGAGVQASASASPAASAANLNPDDALKAIAQYKLGQSRQAVLAFEYLVSASAPDPAKRKALAEKMVAMLGKNDVTPDCKKILCWQLSLVASSSEIPALIALLGDKDLGFFARFALERMPGEEVSTALDNALITAKGEMAVGVINSLGERRDAKSLALIAGRLQDADAQVANAAVEALAKIGTYEAVMILRGQYDTSPTTSVASAWLQSAERFRADGARGDKQVTELTAAYEYLSARRMPPHVRIAAFPGLVETHKDRAPKLVMDALTGADPALQQAALRCLPAVANKQILAALAGKLPSFQPAIQAPLLGAMAQCGDKSVLPAVSKAAQSDNPDVRRSAIEALGALGDVSTIEMLAKMAAEAKDADAQRSIRASLARIKGADVETAMADLIPKSDPAVRRELMAALVMRGARAVVPVFLKAAEDPDAATRKEAAKSLGDLADIKDAPAMIALLGKAAEGERRAIENALAAVCRRAGDADKAVAPIMEAMKSAAPAAQGSLLRVLGLLGGDKALGAVRASLKSPDPVVRNAAVRALADWFDASPLEDLLGVARVENDPALKALALRSFANLSKNAKGLAPDQMSKLLGDALALAARPEDKKALLGALGAAPTASTLQMALISLDEAGVTDEAALAVIQIASALGSSEPAAKAALEKVKTSGANPDIRAQADALLTIPTGPIKLEGLTNLALGAKADSPDDLEKDGQAGGDQAGIDGNPKTYWDEENNKPLYIYRVTFKQPTLVSAISMMAFQQQDYAAKDFEILCDDKVVKTIKGAKYENNLFTAAFAPSVCKTLTLKITGYYGLSPAIRELGIFNLSEKRGAGSPSAAKGANGEIGATGAAQPTVAPFPKEMKLSWNKADAVLALQNHNRVVWQLNYKKEEGKPYIHPLGLPDGTPLTALRPADHVWHRALWFSWKFINGLNYWEEDKKTGLSQGLTELVDVKATPKEDSSAQIEMMLTYHPSDKPALLTEKRTLAISAPDKDGRYRIDWRSDFTAGAEEVKLDRTPIVGEEKGVGYGGYAGLGLRLAETMKKFTGINSEGAEGEKNIHGKPARWVDFTGEFAGAAGAAGGASGTGAAAGATSESNGTGVVGGVSIFDHPSNPRHPTSWSYFQNMPFFEPAFLFREPFTLAAGKTLTLRYRILVHAGKMDKEQLEGEWKSFADLK
ncbi:MAG: PmoA family protein [Candidatus Sumerlaeota bacterium]|nr:PmoA family protein [Candidatus Sumerlaeota bacterium]